MHPPRWAPGLFVFLAGHTSINRYRHGQVTPREWRRPDGEVGSREQRACCHQTLGMPPTLQG